MSAAFGHGARLFEIPVACTSPYPVFFIASQVHRSGAEAASQAEISSVDQRIEPPIRSGAGILPHEFKRKIWRFDKLKSCPKASAVSNFSVIVVSLIMNSLSAFHINLV